MKMTVKVGLLCKFWAQFPSDNADILHTIIDLYKSECHLDKKECHFIILPFRTKEALKQCFRKFIESLISSFNFIDFIVFNFTKINFSLIIIVLFLFIQVFLLIKEFFSSLFHKFTRLTFKIFTKINFH